jgi:hypothetical protein
MKLLLGRGIFMWDAPERRTQRYGYVFVGTTTYENDVKVTNEFNQTNAEKLKSKQVKLTVKVLENRKSGHVGDLFIDVFPTMPQIDEKIVLGVGKFTWRQNPYTPTNYDMTIIPDDGRARYWIPNNLYHLHDQTVEIYGETTKEACHTAPNIKPVREEGVAISNGDGSLQIVGVDLEESFKVKPNIERLSQGLFKLTRPNAEGNKGESFDIVK